jgi:hypothetical protein
VNSQDLTQKEAFLSPEKIKAVRAYIKETWKTLSRSHEHILDAARDPKLTIFQGKSGLYIYRKRRAIANRSISTKSPQSGRI